jgi:hypothetical protein
MNPPRGYDTKFADFNKLISEARANGITEVTVAYPFVIGDNYVEMVESLIRLADAGLALRVVNGRDAARRN